MSTTNIREQPFECNVCNSRFTRHENLKRHSDLHTRAKGDPSFACRLCLVTFSRRDLLDRHVKRKHPDQEEGRPAKVARRDTMTSIGCSRKRSEPKNNSARQPSGSPTVEQGNLLPQLWDTNAYLDLDHISWDMDAALEFSAPDHITGPVQPNAAAVDLLAITNTGGFTAGVVDDQHVLPAHGPHPNLNTFNDAAVDTTMLPTVSSLQHDNAFTNPAAGGSGTSTPSPGSSSDGACSIQVCRREFRQGICRTSEASGVLQKPRSLGVWISTSLVSLISPLSFTGPPLTPLTVRSISHSVFLQSPTSTKMIQPVPRNQSQVNEFHFTAFTKLGLWSLPKKR